MPQRVQLHMGDDVVIDAFFQRSRSGAYYEQTYVTMPLPVCYPYGLDQEWGIRYESTNQRLAVFVPMRPGHLKDPGIAVGVIFPHLTLPTELKVRGGYAIALIDVREGIDLEDRDGWVTLFAERTEGEWLREVSLLEVLMYPIVLALTAREFLKRFLKDVKSAHRFYRFTQQLIDLVRKEWAKGEA